MHVKIMRKLYYVYLSLLPPFVYCSKGWFGRFAVCSSPGPGWLAQHMLQSERHQVRNGGAAWCSNGVDIGSWMMDDIGVGCGWKQKWENRGQREEKREREVSKEEKLSKKMQKEQTVGIPWAYRGQKSNMFGLNLVFARACFMCCLEFGMLQCLARAVIMRATIVSSCRRRKGLILLWNLRRRFAVAVGWPLQRLCNGCAMAVQWLWWLDDETFLSKSFVSVIFCLSLRTSACFLEDFQQWLGGPLPVGSNFTTQLEEFRRTANKGSQLIAECHSLNLLYNQTMCSMFTLFYTGL